MPNLEMPTWEGEPTEEEPGFTHTRPVDNRTADEFQADWDLHQADKKMVEKFGTVDGKPNFQKVVEQYPTKVPESFLSQEERDKELGAHPLTKHELERPN